jgi:hypothetical protein
VFITLTEVLPSYSQFLLVLRYCILVCPDSAIVCQLNEYINVYFVFSINQPENLNHIPTFSPTLTDIKPVNLNLSSYLCDLPIGINLIALS